MPSVSWSAASGTARLSSIDAEVLEMNNAETLARQCAESISTCSKLGIPTTQASVLVTTPHGWKPPPRFPRGQIVQVKEDGTRVRYLPADRLLAWLAGNGLVKIEFEPPERRERIEARAEELKRKIKRSLSRAQVRFMDRWVPAQKHWMETAGFTIGAVAETGREKKSLDALVRHGFAEPDGQFTPTGLAAYQKRVKRLSA
jgi:hypothetical protein